jgi:dephospho-CoA kinase
MDFFNIELDVIARNLLNSDRRPFAVEMRKQLLDVFGEDVRDGLSFINIKKLKRKIFESNASLTIYNSITKEPILTEVRQQMKNPGFYFLNSALLAEGDLGPMCNNNILMVTASNEFRMENLKPRGYSEKELENVLKSQLLSTDKIKALELSQQRRGWGTLLKFVNGPELDNQKFFSIIEQMLYTTDTDWA